MKMDLTGSKVLKVLSLREGFFNSVDRTKHASDNQQPWLDLSAKN